MSHKLVAALLPMLVTMSALAQESTAVDPGSGLIMDENWQLVLANCSSCHSPRLVTQNRMSAEGWLHAIRWMQEKHNLWDLGANEQKIIAYLEKNYGVEALPSRRKPLNVQPLDPAPPESEEQTR